MPHPSKLTLKVVSESRVAGVSSVPILVFLGRIRFSETETGSSLVSTVLSIRSEKLEPVS